MLFAKALLAATALVLVAAAPTAEVSLDKRADGSATYCTAANFGGICVSQGFTTGSCIDLVGVQAGFDKQTVSFKPAGSAICTLFSGHGCTGPADTFIQGPNGISNLAADSFSKMMSSFACTA